MGEHRQITVLRRLNNQEKVVAIEEQEQKSKERKEYRSKFIRLLVIYPAIWIVVSLILFYLVRIK